MATTEEPAVARKTLSSSCEANVVVVGGGLAGLHTALALAERGVSNVTILESSKIGWGASGMSKGLVCPGVQVPEDILASHCSESVADAIYKLSYSAQERVESLISKYAIQCRPTLSGVVEASIYAPKAGEDPDTDEDLLTKVEISTITGSNLYHWGEYDETCIGVDPLGLTRGIARACESLGVTIYENTEALGISNINGTMVVETPGGNVSCEHVVLCSGPERLASSMSTHLANATIPVFTWMVATEPLGDACPLKDEHNSDGSVAKPAPMCADNFVSLNYWRRTEDGRLLFGSLADSYPVPEWFARLRLRHALSTIYPHLADVKFDYCWGGTLAFATNAVPIIGRDQRGVWYATGFGGHGIVPTCMAGTALAEGITGEAHSWRLFNDNLPPPYNCWPFGRLGAGLMLAVYNVFDELHVKGVPVPHLPKPW
jgi:glycine/D-amino acid oxidase-like deaminating enzyme